MMNAKVAFVKVEAVALLMVILVMNIRIAAGILLKAALMEPVRNKREQMAALLRRMKGCSVYRNLLY
jgi:hypothetical protein